MSTWNSSDVSAGIVLSGANLTAANNSGSAAGVRGTQSHTRGDGNKYYIEYAGITLASSNSGIGFATSTWPLTNTSNSVNIASAVNFASVRDGGGGSQAILTGNPAGHVLSVAIDFVNDKYYWRIDNGNWNNSGTANPATGTGGASITAATGDMTGPWFPAAALVSNGDSATIRTKSSDFTQSVPAGFQAWDSTPSLPSKFQATVIH